jgi:hypothetical protein
VSAITSRAADQDDDGQGGKKREPTMTITIASFRSIVAGLILVNTVSPTEWHTPRGDLINRPLLHCYGGRSVCAERMSLLVPARVAARHVGAANA